MVMGQTIVETEVLVIGGGPGGYVAAIRLAQLGYSVIIVDKAGELGGMCLHHGCIPSKAFIHASRLFYEATHSQNIGVNLSGSLDFNKMQEWKKSVVQKLYTGIAGLCKQHGIQIIKADAHFQNSNQVGLVGEGLDCNVIEFRKCIIATGSKPRNLPIAQFGGNILSSREVLQLTLAPRTFCVIGGGYIGIELGIVLAKAGSKVTIIETTSSILGGVEQELAAVVMKRLQVLGIDVRLNAAVEKIEDFDTGVRVVAGGQELGFDKVLVAVGHTPVTQGLQLDLAGVKSDEKGFISVDEQCRTSAKHIFAVGDVTGGMMLAHKASAQGKVAAEAIAGKSTAFQPQCIPAVIFSDPEIATVGLREDEARKQYGDVKVGKFPFAALGKAMAVNDTEGFVKIISDKEGIILGIHAVGPSVTDFISEAALAIEMGATVEDIALTIHPHPTLPESFMEASEVLLGQAIHMYQGKK